MLAHVLALYGFVQLDLMYWPFACGGGPSAPSTSGGSRSARSWGQEEAMPEQPAPSPSPALSRVTCWLAPDVSSRLSAALSIPQLHQNTNDIELRYQPPHAPTPRGPTLASEWSDALENRMGLCPHPALRQGRRPPQLSVCGSPQQRRLHPGPEAMTCLRDLSCGIPTPTPCPPACRLMKQRRVGRVSGRG